MTIEFDEKAKAILTTEQLALAPFLEEFCTTHILVGGTAIALMLGHRKSIDFDLFRFGKQGTGKELAERIEKTGFRLDPGSDLFYLSQEEEPEVNLMIKGVKVQLMDFSRNPFNIPISISASETLCGGIPTPNLLDLAAMKFFALMYRKKWKDAVDLYYILQQHHHDLKKILNRSKQIFTSLLQVEASLETLLENQWDMTEEVEYIGEPLANNLSIQQFLEQEAKHYLESIA